VTGQDLDQDAAGVFKIARRVAPERVISTVDPQAQDSTGTGAGEARFGAACSTCPLAAQCTTAKGGRTITIGPHEARLAAARQAQASPA
jgi:hypothetical protein